MYGSIKELTELAKKESVPIWKIILDTDVLRNRYTTS